MAAHLDPIDEFSTPEAVLKLGIIDPELEELLKVTPPRKLDLTLSPETVRTIVAGMEKQAADAAPTRGTTESIHTITLRDGHKSEIRVVHPEKKPESGSPLLVLFNGGGFFNGTNLQLVVWARNTAYLYGATVALPSYRLAPEHPFPIPQQDAWDNIKWLAANASTIGADTSKGFVVGGGSAGATLAVSVTHRALKEKLSPALTGLFANVPGTLADPIVPEKYRDVWLAREQNSESPVLGKQAMDHISSLYKPDLFSEDYSPFNLDVPFSKVPRTYIQVDGMDSLRDDGIIYARALREEGVDVKLDVYPGCPHGHQIMWPQLKQSGKCQVDVLENIGWLLKNPVDREGIKELFAETK
ncbi:lipase/esterase [Penicillium angulare]|uniref:lipase/esterase n=1 Tax=Penicillium angulare TaxID=116970 RepID=UPI0025410871|nr:lipase/esterase [Penicillium angulare]KAJ5291846.1 lipase/esterase [Penicillium angulare]